MAKRAGIYALALEAEGIQFLIDPRRRALGCAVNW
jgi:hypothetical protein